MEDNPVGESGNEHWGRKKWRGVLDTVKEEKDDAVSMAEDNPKNVYRTEDDPEEVDTTEGDSEDDNLSDVTEIMPDRVQWPDMREFTGYDPNGALRSTIRRARAQLKDDMDFFDEAEKEMDRQRLLVDVRVSSQRPAQDGPQPGRQVFSSDQMQDDEHAIPIRSSSVPSLAAEPGSGEIEGDDNVFDPGMSGVGENPQSHATFSFGEAYHGPSSPPPPGPLMGPPALPLHMSQAQTPAQTQHTQYVSTATTNPAPPKKRGSPHKQRLSLPKFVSLKWMVRGQFMNWDTLNYLDTPTQEAMRAYIHELQAEPRFQAQYRNGNSDTTPFCFGCQLVEKNASLCEHEDDSFTACSTCVHTGKQPCARLFEYPGPQGYLIVGFLPLPLEHREGVTWHQLAYWVRPGPTKGAPEKKPGQRQSSRSSSVVDQIRMLQDTYVV